MKVPIRTLSAKDAEILARSSVSAVVSKGYVERHGLRWRSHALREWELRRRNRNQSRAVELLIDELDLTVVYVVLPAEEGIPSVKLRAESTQPMYTQYLSLYEHQKLKAVLKEKHLQCRLERMADTELYRLRLEYYALLGRQEDPISARRLEKIRDELAARRNESGRSEPPDMLASEEPETVLGEARSPDGMADANPEKPPSRKKRGRPRNPAGGAAPSPPPSADPSVTDPPVEAPLPASAAPEPDAPAPATSTFSSATRGVKANPSFSSLSIRRTPR
ncbi:hypothetical protein [Stagnimonas aquatica]|uniref:hypothetical protein n=1 Tax=Stagnimonas aquatica TaxID=2689987 RepID=UPI0011CD4E8D|nr:hypothetical protein [Stagnimonas aquatica]